MIAIIEDWGECPIFRIEEVTNRRFFSGFIEQGRGQPFRANPIWIKRAIISAQVGSWPLPNGWAAIQATLASLISKLGAVLSIRTGSTAWTEIEESSMALNFAGAGLIPAKGT